MSGSPSGDIASVNQDGDTTVPMYLSEEPVSTAIGGISSISVPFMLPEGELCQSRVAIVPMSQTTNQPGL